MTQPHDIGRPFNVLLYEEEGIHVAHVLELDLVATGETREEAQRNIIEITRAQLEFAREHGNLEHVYRPAPQECWVRLASARMLGVDNVNLTESDADASGFERVDLYEQAVCG